MAGNGAIARAGRDHRPLGLRRAVGRVIIGVVAGVIVVARRLRDRQVHRRPGRRALRARPGRHLGHALLRPLHAPGAGRSTTPSASRGLVYTGSFHQLGAQALGVVVGVRVRVRGQLRHLLGHQEDLRPARHAPRKRTPAWTSPSTACTAIRSSSSRRLSSSATAAARARGRTGDGRRPVDDHLRRCRHEDGRGLHPARGVRADPHGAAELGFPSLSISGGQGLGPAEGHHRALPRRGADELPAPEDQDRVRGRRRDVQTIVDTILKHARTGSIGDGKVFVTAGRGGVPDPHRRVRRGDPPGASRRCRDVSA